mmetsp:Transcript_25119/g.76458  ORF Transcript_25119/g.76458 Transcript_25119/m.76458 type:complete len:208 (+) Transcript_25119:572-1195(+)
MPEYGVSTSLVINVRRTPGIGHMPSILKTWTCAWPPPTSTRSVTTGFASASIRKAIMSFVPVDESWRCVLTCVKGCNRYTASLSFGAFASASATSSLLALSRDARKSSSLKRDHRQFPSLVAFCAIICAISACTRSHFWRLMPRRLAASNARAPAVAAIAAACCWLRFILLQRALLCACSVRPQVLRNFAYGESGRPVGCTSRSTQR